jgi:hypothetical protein
MISRATASSARSCTQARDRACSVCRDDVTDQRAASNEDINNAAIMHPLWAAPSCTQESNTTAQEWAVVFSARHRAC